MADELPVPATLTTPPSSGALQLASSIESLQVAFRQYQNVSKALLDPSDYQRIGDREFMKKSGFRKLATAYNVTVELVERIYERDESGRIIRAEVLARAYAPNGRHMDGLGACDLREKCCPTPCNRRGGHRHCAEGCDGTPHFSNPSHDLPATAATRATNRACADLFGMGEVSAEEVAHGYVSDEPTPSQALKARIDGLDDYQKSRLREFCEEEGIPLVTRDMTPEQMVTVHEVIDMAHEEPEEEF